MDTPESFADYPVSIAELRADKSSRGSSWTPRDALIRVLRELDAGNIKPDALVVCYREPTGEPNTWRPRYCAATPDGFVTVALLETIKFKVMQP